MLIDWPWFCLNHTITVWIDGIDSCVPINKKDNNSISFILKIIVHAYLKEYVQ